jgi:hypothetical protein
MTNEQLSRLHHFSLKGRAMSFAAVYRNFGTRKELLAANPDFGWRLRIVARRDAVGCESFASLVTESLRQIPPNGLCDPRNRV